MKREFLLNIVFLIVINLLIKPFYIFGIDRTVQNTVSSSDYGLYFTLFNFTFLFYIINDFGLQNFNNRHLSQHRQLLAKYFPSFLTLKVLLALIYMIIILIAAVIANYPRAYFHLLLIIGFNWILMSLILFLRSNVSALGWYRTDSLLSVLDRSLMIAVCSVLLWAPAWSGSFRIEWFVYAQAFTLIITTLVAFSITFQYIKKWTFRFRPLYLLLILKQSYPYAMVVFLMTAYTRIDGVMIERMLEEGTQQAGIYAMAYRLLDAANMFGALMASLLLPMFSRMLRERQAVLPLLNMSFRITWVLTLGLALAVFFFRKEIMIGLYVEGDAYSGNILGYLILSFIAVCSTYIHGTLLTAKGSLRQMNIVFVFGIILNISLNWWLIHEMQALGAALATCLTQFAVWLAQVELVRREFEQAVNWILVIRLVLFSGLVLLLCWSVYSQLDFPWLYRFMLCFPGTAFLAFIVGLVRWQELLKLLQNKNEY